MIYNFNLKHKTILITGGYGHLGAAVTESLVHHNATVYVLGRSREKFEKIFSTKDLRDRALFFQECDISETNSIKNAFQKIYENGEIDVLINNAVFSSGQSPEKMTDEDWKLGIDGTLNSVFRCIREIIPYFKEKSSGKIINVSSMYGLVAPEFRIYDDSPAFLNPPHYGAAKAGVIQLTRYYASWLGKYGVQVNAVTPGPFPSPSVQKDESFVEELKSKTCLNRIGNPNDLAGAFVYLASDASNFMTGQNLVIDGGWTIK